jgi:hypothetical protein
MGRTNRAADVADGRVAHGRATRRMPQYDAKYGVGCTVRVARADVLRRFREEWRHHDPLTTEQLALAGSETEVIWVGYDHGGDVLYALRGLPGVWHEVCLDDPARG